MASEEINHIWCDAYSSKRLKVDANKNNFKKAAPAMPIKMTDEREQ